MKRISTSLIVMFVMLLFTGVGFAGTPVALSSGSQPSLVDQSLDAAGQGAYTGTGAARTATLKGMTSNVTGVTNLDSTGTATTKVLRPTGWTGTNLRTDIKGLRAWYYNVLRNGNFSTYHDEIYTERGGEDQISFPDYWRLHKYDAHGSQNATSGYLYFSVEGTDPDYYWRMVIDDSPPDAGEYLSLSQELKLPYMAIEEMQITVSFRPDYWGGTYNNSFMFIKVGTYQISDYCFRSTDTFGARLLRTYTVPGSYLSSLTCPTAVNFEIGHKVKTGVSSGWYGAILDIMYVTVDIKVRPLPDRINMKANSTAILDATTGSGGPYKVPLAQYIAGVSSRDGYNIGSSTFDINGYSDDGHLFVGYAPNWGGVGRMGLQMQVYVPKGAIITSATLTLTGADYSGSPTYPARLLVDVADRSNSATFTQGGTTILSQSTWMNNPVVWQFSSFSGGTKYTSPDISALLQRVVSNSTWASGNYVVLMVSGAYFGGETVDAGLNFYGTAAGVDANVGYLTMTWLVPSSTTEQTKYTSTGSWSSTSSVSLSFQSNATDVSFSSNMYLNASIIVISLDNNLNPGTTFSVANNTVMTWTANVLVSPPVGVGYTNISLSKPATSWTLSSVTDADGSTRTSEVTITSNAVQVKSSVVDVFGIWKFVFTADQQLASPYLQCGINGGSYANTYTYYVGNSASFISWAPYLSTNAERLLLTAPSGQLFYAVDDLTQSVNSPYPFEWTGITVTSAWPAGVWYADVNFNNTKGAVPSVVGRATRSFTVIHATSLSLISPATQITSRIAGNLLYVQVKLTDTDNSALVSGATVTMNWTSPSTVTLDDCGNGYYEKTLNTTDLGTAKRWRIDLSASKSYYSGSLTYFNLDLTHSTFLTYQTPASAPYGDDFRVKVTLYNAFTKTTVPGATITSNGTFFGSPTDHGNGSYTVTFETSGLGVGDYLYRIIATPASAYILASNVTIRFTLRNVYTTTYGVGGSSVSTPYSISTSKIITYNDTDHAFAGIAGASNSVQSPTGVITTVSDSGGGKYTVSINVGTKTVGTYLINITLSKSNYYSSTIRISLTITARITSVVCKYTNIVPYGSNSPFTVTWYDIDGGGANISGVVAISSITVNGTSYGSNPSFAYVCSSLSVRSYVLNVTVNSGNTGYKSSWQIVTLTVRSLGIYIYNEPSDLVFPSGDDFVIVIRVNISEPGNQFNKQPISNLTAAQFTISNSTYTFPKTITALGNGRYNLTISHTYLNMNAYTITILLTPSNSRFASASVQISFSYRAARSYLSSPNYPYIITPYGTSVVVTLNFTDVDRNKGITTADITATGISIYGKTNVGNGIYRVTLNVTGLAKGDHQFNLKATASQYQSQNLTFTLTVRIVFTSVIPTVGSLDIPVGNSPVFYVRFWDQDNNLPIAGATMTSTWIRSLTVTYIPADQRYSVTFATLDTDILRSNYVVTFNFSKGVNYQLGIFNVTITIRTHNTDFRLVSAVQPSSYNGIINVSVYYGDLDNNAGIRSSYVHHKVINSTGSVSSTLYNDTVLGAGFYIIRIPASQFAGLGLRTFTIYFNWTGSVYKYLNKTLSTSVNLVGTDSKYTLLVAAEPTAYLNNMSYMFLYAQLSGIGIDNSSGNVHIRVAFQGESVDLSRVKIWWVAGGNYSIRFNTTVFTHTGLIYMTVYVNWTKGAVPFYTNRTDVISVRILPRDTLVSVIPPSPTSWGQNATFTFAYEDVTGGGSVPIPYNVKMTIKLSLSSYTLTYSSATKLFTVSFNCSQSPIGLAPLGSKSFILNVTWAGSPFYNNRTGQSISITVLARQTVLDYQTPAPTSYSDNVTFVVSWFDVTTGSSVGINGATVTLYDGAVPVSASKYKVTPLGGGSYSIQLNTTYKSSPGTYALKVILDKSLFYLPAANSTRQFSIIWRITLLSSEPVDQVPYNSSIQVRIHYQDLLRLTSIGNGSGYTSIKILNGTSWLFTSSWQSAFDYYLLTIQTYNQAGLKLGTVYTLHLNMTYASLSPFYRWDDAYITFQLRPRTTSLSASSPSSTPYLDYANFTVTYLDTDAGGKGIGSATISIKKNGTLLTPGSQYLAVQTLPGVWAISVNSTALNALTTTRIDVYATWFGTPYYANNSRSVDITVIRRPTAVDVVTPPSLTRYLDNVTFTIGFSDVERGSYIGSIINNILIYNGTKYLTSSQYKVVTGSVAGTFDIRINSTILSAHLLTNYQITVKVYWLNIPYYANATISVRLTTTNRAGALTWDQIDNTPMGDLLNLTFYYKDLDTGLGIANAIVQFDCVQKPGLQVGIDYTLVKGTGVDTGTYYIRVNTNRLLGIRSYNFLLTVLWNAANAPFYTNQTTRNIGGAVRAISASLTPGTPTPLLVPYYGNVSVDVTYYDNDHLRAITNVVKTNVTVTYGSGSGPIAWGFANLGGGVYRITVNTSDSGPYGSKTLQIAFNRYPYTAQLTSVPFTTRLRNMQAAATVPTDLYAGDPSYVTVNISDSDSVKQLAGVTLVITWESTSSWIYIGSGLYNVSFGTTGIPAGSATMEIQATKANYTTQLLILSIYLKPIPIEVVVPPAIDGMSVYWNKKFVIYVFINDTFHDMLVSGATVTYVFGGHSGSLTETSSGNYSATLDTFWVSPGTEVISIQATKNNYAIAGTLIPVNVERIPTTLTTPIYSSSQHRGSPWNISVYFNDTYNNQPVTGATVTISWFYLTSESGTMTSLGGGWYTFNLPTENASIGQNYVINVNAIKTNYQTSYTSLYLSVSAVLTNTNLDNATIEDVKAITYWSQILRVGVLVTANLSSSDPNYTRPDAHVTWEAAGGLRGDFANLGNGSYVCYLNTTELAAAIYTLWIVTSMRDNPYYTDSGAVVTISILKIPTLVIAPGSLDRYWGWKGWLNFSYVNPANGNSPIGNVTFGNVLNATYSWAQVTRSAYYWGDGKYGIYIDTTFVNPSLTPIPVQLTFDYRNYAPASGLFNLLVKPVPTEIVVFIENGVYNPVTDLYTVAYGDDLSIVFYYNASVSQSETPVAGGIAGASWTSPYGSAKLYLPYAPTRDIDLLELGGGNYSYVLRTRDHRISTGTYSVSVELYLANRTMRAITVYVMIIAVPTAITVEGLPGDAFSMFYGETKTFTMHYYDNWSLHTPQGIPNANFTFTATSGLRITITELGGGTYQMTIFADPGIIPIGLEEGRLYADITLSKANFSSALKTITVTAYPTDTQILIGRVVTLGMPVLFIILTASVYYMRVLSVPKQLREINGLIKSIKKGKIPKPIKGVKSRQDLVAGLFNDTFAEMKLVRTGEQMPVESVAVEIPEMGELLIQLSMLTHLNQQELDDFKADISKMKISEQAAFVKEVINQEAMRVARRDGKTIDQVMSDLRAQAQRRVGEAEAGVAEPEAAEVVPEERIILRPAKPKAPTPAVEEVKKAPPTAGEEEIAPSEKLSQYELEELKKQLEQKGVPAHEIDTIMEQAKKLPKYLIDELVKSLTRGK